MKLRVVAWILALVLVGLVGGWAEAEEEFMDGDLENFPDMDMPDFDEEVNDADDCDLTCSDPYLAASIWRAHDRRSRNRFTDSTTVVCGTDPVSPAAS
jgi:hypothetical protein